MSDQLERRLRRVEDALAIGELVARYAIAVDDRDMDTLAGLYAEDAVFDGLTDTLVGRDAVVAYVRAKLAGYDGVSVHTPHAPVLDFASDDTATGTVPAHVEYAEAGAQRILGARYHDRYVRRDGRWYFASRKLQIVYTGPAAEYPGLLADLIRT